MKLQEFFDRVMPSVWRLVIVLLVPALMVTPEMQAQEKGQEFPLFHRTKPTVKIVNAETSQPIRQGTRVSLTVEFAVNRKIFGTQPTDVRIAALRATVQAESGIATGDDLRWQHKVGERWISAPLKDQLEEGDWRVIIPIEVAASAAKGGRELRGNLQFVPVTGKPDFAADSVAFKSSVHIAGPYEEPSKWKLLWQVPAMAPLLPVFVLVLPFVLIFALVCDLSHEECG